jgi:hypothetical protein
VDDDGGMPAVPLRVLLLAVLAAPALSACAGGSPLEACVQHSVDEGVDRARAEQACRDAGLGDER